MDKKRETFLKKKANYIRDEILRVTIPNGAGHIASSLSCVDILTALYYHCISYNPKNTFWDGRDRLVFSKAHGCYALYAILVDLGVIPKKEWNNFNIEGESKLRGCVERQLEYGLEVGCGSLGHGLPIAVGIAFGAQLQKKLYYTFCVVGDGELEEGTNWEALQFGVKHEVKNLIVIIDNNRLGAMDFLTNIMDRQEGDLIRKLKGFGLSPVVCSGHNIFKLVDCIQTAKSLSKNKPQIIVAKTIKGFGLKCMENVPKFHYRVPTEEDLKMGKTYESKS
ncbi:MAG: transketolase [Candidatus Paceibacterota bacterium]|jgi:transketolase